MGKINILDFSIANLIAAGEVVERPASAVKELMENAVDAGATEITVEIKRGGITFIRVADNGCGMSAEDMPVAIKRHATSKISKATDLDSIMTLGFRGEALAAIASVSQMRIISKRKSDEMGTLLVSNCGRVEEISQTGCKDGTTVIIEELFANVPARRKFLKKDSSEGAAVISTVQKIALSHPDIAVKMINNGNLEFKTPGDSKVENCIYAVMGREFASKMMYVNSMFDRIEVYGYVGRPDNVRANRNYQNFFINNRYVRSKTATAALEQAFDSYMEAGKFPTCVLYINIHPALVDVNVHPTKLEVKFSNEKTVFESVYCAVKNAILASSDRPEVIFEKENMTPSDHSLYNAFVPVYDRVVETESKKVTPLQLFETPTMSDGDEIQTPAQQIQTPSNTPEKEAEKNSYTAPYAKNTEFKKNTVDFSSFDFGETHPTYGSAVTSNYSEDKRDTQDSPYLFSLGDRIKPQNVPEYKILGEAFNTYISVESEGVVIIIDKHAAHERILFEQMKRIMKSGKKASQLIMIPYETSLSPEELESALQFEEDIKAVGFSFIKENSRVLISEIPSGISESDAIDMFVTMVSELSTGQGSIEVTKEHFFEKALYQASCKAATKAGWTDSSETVKWIVECVLGCSEIRYCPHGRPVAVELSKSQIEKIFKRT